MLALGLASARFFSFIYDQWTEIQVDLPQVNSETPIIITPKPILTKELIYKRSLISKDRDLSQFDNGGTYTDQCLSQSVENNCKTIIDARKFILKHWKEKTRAKIKYEWSGVDTEGDIHIFVEPDDKGKWRIIWIDKYYGFDLQDRDNLRMEEFYSVKFKLAKNDDFSEIGNYYLSFSDENGKEIRGF